MRSPMERIYIDFWRVCLSRCYCARKKKHAKWIFDRYRLGPERDNFQSNMPLLIKCQENCSVGDATNNIRHTMNAKEAAIRSESQRDSDDELRSLIELNKRKLVPKRLFTSHTSLSAPAERSLFTRNLNAPKIKRIIIRDDGKYPIEIQK